MVGFGPEDDHFVVELTYNYGIGKYKLGNDFHGLVIGNKGVPVNLESCNFLASPDGYAFHVAKDLNPDSAVVQRVIIGCKSISRSLAYWRDLVNHFG